MNLSNFFISLLAVGAAASRSIEQEEIKQGNLRSNFPLEDQSREKIIEQKSSSPNLELDDINISEEDIPEKSRRLQDGSGSITTYSPTNHPTRKPTFAPTPYFPTIQPSEQPSEKPTGYPSGQPSSQATGEPTFQPTIECKDFEDVQFTTEVFNEDEVEKFLNLTRISSSLSELVDGKCALQYNLAEDLNSCVDVINLSQVNTTADIEGCSKAGNSITALEFISCINSNPEAFKDEQICFNLQKGNVTETDYSIKECNNTANDVLASIGFNCASSTEIDNSDDKIDNDLNNFLFYFSLVGGAINLAGIVYLGAKKEIGNGLTFCEQNEEFFSNVFDSCKENKMGFVVGAGTLATIGISKLALEENDFLKNFDSFLPELGLAIPNAIALAAIGYQIYNSDKSVSSGNKTFSVHHELKLRNNHDHEALETKKPKTSPSSRAVTIEGADGEEIDISLPIEIEKLDKSKESNCVIS